MFITIKFMCVLHTKLSKINPFKQEGGAPGAPALDPPSLSEILLRMPNINIF